MLPTGATVAVAFTVGTALTETAVQATAVELAPALYCAALVAATDPAVHVAVAGETAPDATTWMAGVTAIACHAACGGETAAVSSETLDASTVGAVQLVTATETSAVCAETNVAVTLTPVQLLAAGEMEVDASTKMLGATAGAVHADDAGATAAA